MRAVLEVSRKDELQAGVLLAALGVDIDTARTRMFRVKAISAASNFRSGCDHYVRGARRKGDRS